MEKYKKNLRIEGDKVWSYKTHVATISGDKLIVHGHWTVTTSKHINYVARELGLGKIVGPREFSKQKDGGALILKRTAAVAKLGEFFGQTQKEKNDWKARMLKAGLGNSGFEMPADWDELDEETKEARLNAAIDAIK